MGIAKENGARYEWKKRPQSIIVGSNGVVLGIEHPIILTPEESRDDQVVALAPPRFRRYTPEDSASTSGSHAINSSPLFLFSFRIHYFNSNQPSMCIARLLGPQIYCVPHVCKIALNYTRDLKIPL
jgi:hypothetical protein